MRGRHLLLAVAVALVGCRKKAGRPAARPEVEGRTLESDALFPHALAVVRRRDQPPRDDKPLPVTRDDLGAMRAGDSRFPPQQLVVDLLCAGDPSMRTRWRAALMQTPEAEHDVVAAQWGDLLRYCTQACGWAPATLAETHVSPERKALFYVAAECAGLDAAFAEPGVPARALVRHLGAHPAFSQRLVDAVADMMAHDDWQTVEGLHKLADTGDPKAADALIVLRGKYAADDVRRDEIAALLGGFPQHAGAHKLYRELCARKPTFYECKHPPPAAARPSSVDELARCVRDPGTPHQNWRECMEALVRADRTRAVAEARAGLASFQGPRAAIARALDRFPEADTLRARLAALGLLGPRAPAGTPLDPEGWLEATGRLASFDTETGEFPNQHDSLLRAKLAPLTGGALARVPFGEEPPSDARDPMPYRLHAWMDGWRYDTVADNLGDWYDVTAAVGFLNHLLAERESALRCLTLETGGQGTTVVCGPPAGLKTAIAEGLLTPARPDAGRAAGKAFEDQLRSQHPGADIQ